ncbi:hypothetical protein [Novipirellula aureliae]|nr:hypothetical protein [Novipirellula aureliae]
MPVSRSRPLGPQSLATRIAMLDYIVTTKPRLRLLVDKEINTLIAGATTQHRAMPHLVELGNPDCPIRLVRIDLGGAPSHVAKKLGDDVRKRQSHSAYSKLIAKSNLMLVVVTATPTKKKLIEAEIVKRTWPKGIRFSVTVVSSLSAYLGAL